MLWAKVEVVENAWDHALIGWMDKAVELKDEGMKRIIKRILEVKPIIKSSMLRNYIR